MKIVLQYFVISCLFSFSLLAKQQYAVILQYHRFDDERYPSTNISMKLFTQQIEYLIQYNYNILPLSKVVRFLRENRSLPDKTVVITIDDAYKTVYTKAYPLLKKHHLPYTVFVNTMPIEHRSKNYLSWDEMREMGKHGAEFANHSYSHPYLVRKRFDMTQEIQKAQEKLEKELGDRVCSEPKMFAYPFGEYDKKLMDLVAKLGYVGIAQNSGPISNKSNFMALTRFPMSGGYGVMDQFVVKINTLPLPLQSVENEDTLVDESNNPPLLTLTLQQPLKAFQCFNANGQKLAMQWLSDTKVTIQSAQPLLYPRNHYTCTAPAEDGRWYWYSHLWVVLK
ncbi:Polysaccharide deacetylase [hydrothermal vent metagenome]|uniref:Polysaccharide deacetylase n=1 Tax=hydrothermal vent metagenome TaxID=652676 RepID=A0A1W1C3S4_9ZZZZ